MEFVWISISNWMSYLLVRFILAGSLKVDCKFVSLLFFVNFSPFLRSIPSNVTRFNFRTSSLSFWVQPEWPKLQSKRHVFPKTLSSLHSQFESWNWTKPLITSKKPNKTDPERFSNSISVYFSSQKPLLQKNQFQLNELKWIYKLSFCQSLFSSFSFYLFLWNFGGNVPGSWHNNIIGKMVISH